MVENVAGKVIKLLRKRGYLKKEADKVNTPPLDGSFDQHPCYRDEVAASIRGRSPSAPMPAKIRKIGNEFGFEGELPTVKARFKNLDRQFMCDLR